MASPTGHDKESEAKPPAVTHTSTFF